MRGWVEREAPVDVRPIEELVKEARRNAQMEILQWAMSLSFTGMTPAMIRRQLHNKFVEVSGEGEKA